MHLAQELLATIVWGLIGNLCKLMVVSSWEKTLFLQLIALHLNICCLYSIFLPEKWEKKPVPLAPPGCGFHPFSQIDFWLEAKSYTGSQWLSAHLNPGFSCLSVPLQPLDHNSILCCLKRVSSLWEREENSQQNSLGLLTFDKNEETALLIFKRLPLSLCFP